MQQMQHDEFRNEPFTDFSKEENARAMREAIAQVKSELGREYPLVVGGERIKTGRTFDSLNPAKKTEVVGSFQKATEELARAAVERANEAFQTWRNTPAAERADVLFRVAALLRERRHYFSAWMIHEVAKSWPEADGDTAEAIDFCEFYAREMLRYAAPQPLTRIEGEDNRLEYIPLGVGVVIPPWNFPLAIMAGMTVASFVTGNTVVLKPSSDAPAIAYKFFELLEEAGLPPGVVNFMTGSGGEVGDTVVDHPQTRYVAFTGSKEIGLRIVERASKAHDGQIWIKRVVAEMGGKDAIIVDSDTDVDEAAASVVASAFGFQGQKCSACSRAIIVEGVYESVLQRIVEGTEKLKVGDPTEQATGVSAVINQKAFKTINDYIEKGKADGGRIVAGGGSDGEQGFFVEPTVIADVKAGDRVEQEEIFGPVLACIRARDFDEALRIANDTEYGLTGSVYTNDREKLERARREFHVGNLYLNRKCTGALVGVHPFGGFNMSGTDSKAGGRDYLGLFLQAKVTSEKIRPGYTQTEKRGVI
ncbi:MAG TPA: L-glutamate gamma-semialdehyde dehydrogenase [Pyrinomonadaceae bacterium]|jgi:1-pyrroline-5-carboxylate dehydrogenase|nr:L-glutamate gamma-semialdehyde dehydrogenase [Pyrinomonadaceae bacterium]